MLFCVPFCIFHLKLMGVGGGRECRILMYDKLRVHAFNSFSLTRHALPELSCTNKTKITWENSTVSGIFQYRLYSLGYIYLCLQAQLSINFWWFWWLLWPLLEIGSLESVVVLKELRTDNKNFLVNQMTWIYHAIRGFFRGWFFSACKKLSHCWHSQNWLVYNLC